MAQFSSEATIAKGYRDISDRQNQCGLRLLGEISLTPGGVVLDMGCGSGYLASVLAETTLTLNLHFCTRVIFVPFHQVHAVFCL